MKRSWVKYLLLFFFIFAIFAGFIFLKYKNSRIPNIGASSASNSITTLLDWDAGAKDNIDTASSEGSIEISDKNQGSEIFSESMTACWDQAGTGATIDGNAASVWGNIAEDPECGPQITYYFGSNPVTIGRIGYIGTEAGLLYSTNGTNWYVTTPFNLTGTGYPFPPDMVYTDFTPFTAKYLRLDYGGLFVREIDFFSTGATATHTTGATQIDGGENFWSWDSNTIAQTVPANTTATYQYRTSANGTDWTSWVGSIGSVTSRTGDDSNNPTRYRYLQVKATLTNTDGISTPTIDSYSIDYHTEAKPSAPTAQTAVVR